MSIASRTFDLLRTPPVRMDDDRRSQASRSRCLRSPRSVRVPRPRLSVERDRCWPDEDRRIPQALRSADLTAAARQPTPRGASKVRALPDAAPACPERARICNSEYDPSAPCLAVGRAGPFHRNPTCSFPPNPRSPRRWSSARCSSNSPPLQARRARLASVDAARPSPAQRGYDGAWRALRQRVLEARPICEQCPAPATEVHHVLWVRDRPDLRLDLSNLMCLCRSCHSRITACTQAFGRRNPRISNS